MKVTRRTILTAGGWGLAAWAAAGCTPLRVLTHHVTQAEQKVPVGRYMLDPYHWSIEFDVGHFGYSRFTTRFDRATAQLDWRAGGLDASGVSVQIDAASIDTKVPLLDRIVRGSEGFDAARYPDIRFVSTGFKRGGDAHGVLTGNLTIRGTTRPVELDVRFNGYGRNPLTRQDTLGFSATGTFSRSQFGVTSWYPAVSDDVRVRIQAEFVKNAAGG